METQMADQRNGGIAWCTETWNPLRGCSRVSDGCRNCYAEAMAGRFSGVGQPYEGLTTKDSHGTAKWNGTIKLVHDKLTDPLRWKRPRMVFVNSMSDLFHESVPDDFIDQVFAVMALAKQHTFQVLTKRPERMLNYLRSSAVRDQWVRAGDTFADTMEPLHYANLSHIGKQGNLVSVFSQWPLPNVWLGVTVENQEAADERIPLLLQTPAAVRWLSMEPLLGAVDLAHACDIGEEIVCDGSWSDMKEPQRCLEALRHGSLKLLDWVVVGGESGSNARPMHPEWARSLRDQCAEAGVPFLFKQWGEWHTNAFIASTGEPVFRQFDSFQQWVNKAQTWVQGGICLDCDGRELKNGGDMMRARDDGKFPVTIMHRVGKKAAGRLLDGALHDGYPHGVEA
jgi:protein gp37